MIENITNRLFAEPPRDTLYHYTSLPGMLGIVGSGILRASDIRYMNDSAELKHTLDLLRDHITARIMGGTDHPEPLKKLLDWLSHRVVSGPMLFGGSFRANGNLLSQWRGYSMHGKGVSLGFEPEHIHRCASRQGFQVGRCIYDSSQQESLIQQIVDAVEDMALEYRGDEHRWAEALEQIEGWLLRIASVLKHPSFEEEQEWRIVSPVIHDTESQAIQFREGASMLVPFYAFELTAGDNAPIRLEHVFLGPTSNIDLSMNSLRLYLGSRGAAPKSGISYCQIPYRQR